jgi:ABC-type polysaccharide/polyol phosphate export permease
MLAYLGAIWKCRYFWLSLVKMDLRMRYRGSVLGMGWSLLHPIAMTAIICTAFGTIFNADIHFYAPFLMAGLTCWIYLVNVSQMGGHCFFQGECYIRQHPAPLAIYPLRTMLACAFHFGLALLLVILLSAGLRGLGHPGSTSAVLALLSLVPTLVLLLLLGWALATVFGILTVRFRDAHHITELGFQGLFYLTPVIYEPRLLQGRGLGFLLAANPVVPFLDLLRQPILYGHVPPLSAYAAAVLIVLATAGAASLLLWREERRLIFLL